MTDHVYRKFSQHREAIQVLLQENTTFKEICDDYEEICTWLAFYRRSESRASEEYDRAREMIRDLEDEINKVLSNYGL
jgi:uncharacterized protein YdcH (DUF465 family)